MENDASIQECFNKYVSKKQGIELDSENDEEPDDIEDEQKSFQVTPREALAMIDRLVHTSWANNDDQNDLIGIKENLVRTVITQKSKKTYVTISNVFYRRDIILIYRNISYWS